MGYMKKILIVLTLSFLSLLLVGILLTQEKDVLEIEELVLNFVNQELLMGQTTANLINLEQRSDVYKLELEIEGEKFTSYATKDGQLFFPDGLEISFKESIVDNLPLADKVYVYNFWGDGCPFCEQQKPYLDRWNELENVEVITFETYYEEENQAIFEKVASAYGTNASGVPMTFIGKDYWSGFSEELGEKMEEKINQCLKTGCINPGDVL